MNRKLVVPCCNIYIPRIQSVWLISSADANDRLLICSSDAWTVETIKRIKDSPRNENSLVSTIEF